MRAVYGAWLAALAVTSTICRAEVEYPYELTIERDGVEVRSGPGQDFYLTDRLTAGETIEVYRREPGDWLAIRPPIDSFSLVKRSALRQSSSGNVATVLRDGTTCRVGSLITKAKQNATHVLLHAGELVELLEAPDASRSQAADPSETWVRIWPPAGEFRWVRAGDVQAADRGPPTNDQADDQPDNRAEDRDDDRSDEQPAQPNTQRPEPTAGVSDPPDGQQQPPSTSPTASLPPSPVELEEEIIRVPTETPVRVPTEPAGNQSTTPTRPPVTSAPAATPSESDNQSDGSPWRERTDTERGESGQNDAEMVRVPSSLQPSPVTAAAPQGDPQATEETPSEQKQPAASAPVWVSRHRALRDDLDGLELELAMMVSQEMRAWRLGQLRERVEQASSRLGDPAQQARAQQLLVRIGEFERLADRASGAASAGATADSTAVQPLIPDSPNGEPSPATAVKYDGSGWLVPVHATKGTVPPYALLDVQGDVMHYVSPTPGLNLQRYVRRRIGVFGQQGFVRSLNKPHVTAERVVDLDRHLR